MFHPTAAFFAKRDIARGEELTFNYDPNKNKRWALQRRGEQAENGGVDCRCGAPRCRGNL